MTELPCAACAHHDLVDAHVIRRLREIARCIDPIEMRARKAYEACYRLMDDIREGVWEAE